MKTDLDPLDRKILRILQEDATLPMEEIARRTGSSKTPVWNRIRRLRERGVIRAEVALVSPEAVGLTACFFVVIKTSQHAADWLDRFTETVQSMPEIVEAHRLAGEIDYILKVHVADAHAFDAFYKRLVSRIAIFKVTSSLSMEAIRSTTILPIPEADAAES